jgi:heme/copper-type cytochrome/quinol oxidase subunit 3
MKSIREILGKKSFRLELLLVTTLVIISASVFVYAGMPYQGALNVGNSTGSDISFSPATMIILLVSGVVAGLSLFAFRREAAKHVSNAPRAGGSLPAVFKSAREEEWEESPRKEESEVEDEHEPVQD